MGKMFDYTDFSNKIININNKYDEYEMEDFEIKEYRGVPAKEIKMSSSVMPISATPVESNISIVKDEYTFTQYSESVKDMIPWKNFDDPNDIISHGMFGLSSEVGEVASILQHTYQGREIDTEHMKKELGDVLWFLNELCIGFGFDLADVANTNYRKLYARFGGKDYNEKADNNRKKDDI